MKLVHKDFELNNLNFSSSEELIVYSKTISEALHSLLIDWFSSSDHMMVNTSGSTGKPKQIELRKEYMINSAKATGDFFDLKEKTTALCCLPIEYIAGKMMMIRALTLGWHIDVVDPSSEPLKDLDKFYDFSAMVPLQLRNSLNQLNLIGTLIVGGGAVSSDLEKGIQSLSTKIYATYGMTETITHIALKPLNITSSEVERSHYKTLPNVSISTDSRNCLVIEAPKVSDDKVITNDIVEILTENEFKWKGRFDNVINSGGVKLHPEEIETKLSNLISSRFFVAGIPDSILGEKLILIVEGIEGDFDPSLLQDLRGNSLNSYQIPKAIYYVSQFVETETGKIQRPETLKRVKFL